MPYAEPIELPYTFEGSKPIHLDIYLPPGHDAGKKYKTAVFYHGGGLVLGSKRTPNPALSFGELAEQDYIMISPDYHLLPEATGWHMRRDTAAVEQWILAHAEEYGIDLARVALGGLSAGGYLAMLSVDTWTSIKPRVLVDMFGMVDIASAWNTAAKPASTTIAGFELRTLKKESYEPFFRPGAEPTWSFEIDVTGKWDMGGRNGLYHWAIKEGLILDMLMGSHPEDDEKKLLPLEFVGESFPPTVIYHGDYDTMVPIEGSYSFWKKLGEKGVEREMLAIPGQPHGVAKDGNEESWSMLLKFMEDHMG